MPDNEASDGGGRHEGDRVAAATSEMTGPAATELQSSKPADTSTCPCMSASQLIMATRGGAGGG
eukprot:6040051-Alexandrium_andersonii.AAC.1